MQHVKSRWKPNAAIQDDTWLEQQGKIAVWKKGWKSRGHQSEGSSFQGGTVGSYLTGSRWLVWHHPFYSDAQVSG